MSNEHFVQCAIVCSRFILSCFFSKLECHMRVSNEHFVQCVVAYFHFILSRSFLKSEHGTHVSNDDAFPSP